MRDFAFEGPSNVRSENGIGYGNIMPSKWTVHQQLVVDDFLRMYGRLDDQSSSVLFGLVWHGRSQYLKS